MVFVSTRGLSQVNWDSKTIPPSSTAAPVAVANPWSTSSLSSPPPAAAVIAKPVQAIPLADFVAEILPGPSFYERGVGHILHTISKIETLLRPFFENIEAFLERQVPSLIHRTKDVGAFVTNNITFFITTYPVVSGIILTTTITLCIVWAVKKIRQSAEQKNQIAKFATAMKLYRAYIHLLKTKHTETLAEQEKAHREAFKEAQEKVTKFMTDNPEFQVHEILLKDTAYRALFEASGVHKNIKEKWTWFLRELEKCNLTARTISPVRSANSDKDDSRSSSPLENYH